MRSVKPLLLALLLLHRIKQAGLSDGHRHNVRVTVRCRASILEVAPLVLAHLPGDADASSPVGHAGGEVVDARGFVQTCEAPLVVLAAAWVVLLDVLLVLFGQFLYGLLNVPVGREIKRVGLIVFRSAVIIFRLLEEERYYTFGWRWKNYKIQHRSKQYSVIRKQRNPLRHQLEGLE